MARLRTNPGAAPELLAMTAITAMGPRAAAWADQTRQTYPAADTPGLIRLALRRADRSIRVTAVTAFAAGLLAPAVDLAGLVWANAELVLRIAAAHGVDPTDPERAAELLVLMRVHPSVPVARRALAEASGDPRSGPPRRRGIGRLAAPVAAQVGAWRLRRTARRLAPGAGMLLILAGDAAATERLAARAITFYRASGAGHAAAGRAVTAS